MIIRHYRVNFSCLTASQEQRDYATTYMVKRPEECFLSAREAWTLLLDMMSAYDVRFLASASLTVLDGLYIGAQYCYQNVELMEQ
jgi:hypothetical protein